ncbi:MAG TPA: hypothetical protein VGL21_11480 [Jatrophihabitantaceae bacterium]
MAGTTAGPSAATADTPVSTTVGPNGQKIETYQQWNVQDWFDTPRWTLTGTQADSDIKAGMWWQDSQDLNNKVAPVMRTAAAQWDAQYAKLDAAQDKLKAARTTLAGYKGADADQLNRALDNLSASLNQRAEATEPISKALTNSASVIETNHRGPMTTLWDKWEQDLANAPQCKADVEQMQPVISDMAQSVLDAANAIQKGYQTEIEPPEIETAQPNPAGDDSSSDDGSQTSDLASKASTTTPGVVTTAGSTPAGAGAPATTAIGTAPGTVVSPTAAGTTHAAVASTHTAAANLTTAGTATPAGTAPTVSQVGSGPSLAGIGASTTAPTVPSAPAFAPSPLATAGGGAAAPLSAGLPAAGFAGSPAVGGAGLAGAGFVPFGGGTSGRNSQQPRRDDDERRQQGGVVSPVVGGVGAGRGGRATARIRPGDARRPTNAGVAAGLLGRAAKDAESAEVAASTRRKASKTASRRDGNDQDMFLDEDAWLIDDPGAGVVEAHQPHDPGAASAVIG